MRFRLPETPPSALRPALTDPAALRAWWDPETSGVHGLVSPGLDDGEMTVSAADTTVTWRGSTVAARFDLAGGIVTLGAAESASAALDLDPADAAELALSWEVALATLGWALRANGPAAWTRRELPLALAYSDAWGRLVAPEGLAAGDEGAETHVRVAGARVPARVLLRRPERAVVLDLGDTLVRVVFAPGESVNVSLVDAIVRSGDTTLPPDWETWITRRLGMTWVAQLGEDG